MSGRYLRWFGLGCALPGLLTVWLPDALLESRAGPAYLLWLFASGNAAWVALEAIRARNESSGVDRPPSRRASRARSPSSGTSRESAVAEGDRSRDERVRRLSWGAWWGPVVGCGIVVIAVGASGGGIPVDERSATLGVTGFGVACLGALWGAGWIAERRGRREG